MKKFIGLIFMLAVLLCAFGARADQIEGVWTLVDGGEITLTFYADGTVNMSEPARGMDVTCDWVANGDSYTLINQGRMLSMRIEGDYLKYSQGGEEKTFARQAVGAADDEIIGMWKYDYVIGPDGTRMSAAAIGADITMEFFADGKAITVSTRLDAPEIGSWTKTGDGYIITMASEPVAFTISNGELIGVLENSDSKIVLTRIDGAGTHAGDKILGEWELIAAEEDGYPLGGEIVNGGVRLEFFANGTAEMTDISTDDIARSEWAAAGDKYVLTRQGEQITMYFEGEYLMYTDSTLVMTFARPGGAQIDGGGAQPEASEIDNYLGEWILVEYTFMGTPRPDFIKDYKSSLMIFDDGTLESRTEGRDAVFWTWEYANGVFSALTPAGETRVLTLADGALSHADEIQSSVYMRPEDAANYDMPEARSPFVGAWRLVGLGGVDITGVALEFDLIVIPGGAARAHSSLLGAEAAGEWMIIGDEIFIDFPREHAQFKISGGYLVGGNNTTMHFESYGKDMSYIGTWELACFTKNGLTQTPEDLGYTVTLSLQSGGGATAKNFGRTSDFTGTWAEQDGGIYLTIDGESIFMTLENGLLISDDQAGLIFYKR